MNKKTIYLALENLKFDTVNTSIRGRALAECIEEILPKLSEMDAKAIEERKGNIAYLRQCHAFLAPYIRELKSEIPSGLYKWSEGEPKNVSDRKAKCKGVKMT